MRDLGLKQQQKTYYSQFQIKKTLKYVFEILCFKKMLMSKQG